MGFSCGVISGVDVPPSLAAGPIDLGQGVWLGPIPSWVQDEKALQWLSWLDRERITSAHLAFWMEYEGEPVNTIVEEADREVGRSKGQVADEKLMLVGVAAWIGFPARLSAGPVFHFGTNEDPSSLRNWGSVRPFLYGFEAMTAQPSCGDLERIGALYRRICALKRKENVWLALRMLVRAATEDFWEARFVLMWVVLEALFGPENGREATYRISQRLALFLGPDGVHRAEIYRRAKDCYGWRSRVVHGARLGSLSSEQSHVLMQEAEGWIRASFLKILGSDELEANFGGKKRDGYLDGLVLR